MARFLVQAYYKSYFTVDVEADSEEEAREIAMDYDMDDYDRCDPDADVFEIWDIYPLDGDDE